MALYNIYKQNFFPYCGFLNVPSDILIKKMTSGNICKRMIYLQNESLSGSFDGLNEKKIWNILHKEMVFLQYDFLYEPLDVLPLKMPLNTVYKNMVSI